MNQEIKPLDQFAEIALREHPLKKDGLSEIQPISFVKRDFRPSTTVLSSVNKPTYEEQLKQFHHDLKNMRRNYQGFLENHVPAMEQARRTMELKQFNFRNNTLTPQSFLQNLAGEGEWEKVTLPDFRGPTKEAGRWIGYYRTQFEFPHANIKKRVYLVFKGVDYKASVYLNHRWIGGHEGFFSPFEFDITDELQEINTLLVEVHNDFPMMGVDGSRLDGDKIYAATGPGWDESQTGWHHCPPGGGIYNKVVLEERAELFVQDIYVRPNIDDGSIEAWIDVVNTVNQISEPFQVHIDVFPRNFQGEGIHNVKFQVPYAGPGINFYRYQISFPAFRLWELDQPCLYTLRVKLRQDQSALDCKDGNFGMRKFHMDEASLPKGTLTFNNRPIMLRGTNEMGHLQQCVMKEDYVQLIDDILIAKLANMNFYRITQRPVQEEIYDYMDRLGMLNQCDLPTFGYIRRNQFNEAVRQSAEMERLVRSHPSTIMVSLINEPSRPAKRGKGHRHLFRDELEAFFTAARKAIYIENPDRIVKNAEGDYDPPTETGLSDFHCYNMWYTNHAVPFGRMYKGYLPSIRSGWKTGCGEYGAEGLDPLQVMRKDYPQEWMPEEDADLWMPDQIVAAQTFSMHGDWYPEQNRLADWVAESQYHQAESTRLLTDAWRRRSDWIVSTAIHLLIDAWPSGWMKALIGVDRIPKPAFFSYQICLEPLRVNLRCDRWKVYGGDEVEVEAWLLNDTAEDVVNYKVLAVLRNDANIFGSYEMVGQVNKAASVYAGTVSFRVPLVDERQPLYLDAYLLDTTGRIVNSERFEWEVFERTRIRNGLQAVYMGTKAETMCSELGISSRAYPPRTEQVITYVISSQELFNLYEKDILANVRAGGKALFIESDDGTFDWRIDGTEVKSKEPSELYFLASDPLDNRLKSMQTRDFSYFYNRLTDQIDYIAGGSFEFEGMRPHLYTYQKSKIRGADGQGKPRLTVVGSKEYGAGEFILIHLQLDGRVSHNPVLDQFLYELIDPSNKSSENNGS